MKHLTPTTTQKPALAQGGPNCWIKAGIVGFLAQDGDEFYRIMGEKGCRD